MKSQTTFYWTALILAGVFEVVWVYFLKQSDSFSKLVATGFFIITSIASMVLLAYAMRGIPVSVSYPIWTGIGAIGSVLVGLFLFGETLGTLQIVFLCLVITGILGLKITS